jgi:hypothetical protein
MTERSLNFDDFNKNNIMDLFNVESGERPPKLRRLLDGARRDEGENDTACMQLTTIFHLLLECPTLLKLALSG